MRKATKRLAIAAAVGLVIASASTGAALANSANDSEWLTGDEFDIEWATAIQESELELPADTSWPNAPAALVGDDVRVERGASQLMLAFYWLCSWESEYLQSDDGSKVRSEAAEAIQEFSELAAVREGLIGLEMWESNVANGLNVASPVSDEAVGRDFAMTCSGYEGVNK